MKTGKKGRQAIFYALKLSAASRGESSILKEQYHSVFTRLSRHADGMTTGNVLATEFSLFHFCFSTTQRSFGTEISPTAFFQ